MFQGSVFLHFVLRAQLDRGDSLGSKRGRKLTKACAQKDGYRATEKAEYESWDVAASRPA